MTVTMTVKVHIDEDKGVIAFAPVVEDGSTGDGGEEGIGEGQAGSDDGKGEDDQAKQKEEDDENGGEVPMAPRYGCDPRTAWSPWR